VNRRCGASSPPDHSSDNPGRTPGREPRTEASVQRRIQQRAHCAACQLGSRTVQPSVNTPHNDSCARFWTKPVLRCSDPRPDSQPVSAVSHASQWSTKNLKNAVERVRYAEHRREHSGWSSAYFRKSQQPGHAPLATARTQPRRLRLEEAGEAKEQDGRIDQSGMARVEIRRSTFAQGRRPARPAAPVAGVREAHDSFIAW
jgi:hypothetical protein